MYPYVDIISIETYNTITNNGQDTSMFDEEQLVCIPIETKDLEQALFSLPSVIQSHLIEVFNISGGMFNVTEDSIVADLDVDEINGYQDITPMLNKSFEIIGLSYKYPFKLFIPDNLKIAPKRYEYAYIQLPLAFTLAHFLYKKAQIIIEENGNCNELMLVKTMIEE